MKIALIPCARTEWQTEGRILGHAALAAADGAEADLQSWAESLAPLAPKQILHGPDELATRTARLLARRLRSAARTTPALREVDMGLWTGLTEEQLRERFGSAYRGICDTPLQVSPPQGESFADAADRLRSFLRRRLKRNGDAALGLVLRPCARALLHCLLDGGAWDDFWPRVGHAGGPVVLDVDAALHMLEGSHHG